MSYLLQFRNDTAQAWNDANPILAAGEAGFDTTNLILKIGTGSTAWSSLQGISLPATAAAATPGIISQFAGSTAPAGYLLCQGQEIAISAHPALHAVLGTTYGALTNGSGGTGTTHFRIPNFQGRVPVGVGTAPSGNGVALKSLATSGGDETVAITEAQMPSHNHSGTTSTNGSHSHVLEDSYLQGVPVGGGSTVFAGNRQYSGWGDTRYVQAAGDHSHTITTNSKGSGSAHNNLQPYIVVNYIIKT